MQSPIWIFRAVAVWRLYLSRWERRHDHKTIPAAKRGSNRTGKQATETSKCPLYSKGSVLSQRRDAKTGCRLTNRRASNPNATPTTSKAPNENPDRKVAKAMKASAAVPIAPTNEAARAHRSEATFGFNGKA